MAGSYGSKTFYGNNGGVRVNYTEVLNQSAGTSTITVDSVQLLSTNYYGVVFYACGRVYIGSTCVLNMNGENGYSTGYVDSQNTWYTVSNSSGSQSVTVTNNGTNSTCAITVAPYGGYNDFNAWCIGYQAGNIEVGQETQYIALSKYTTDTASSISVPAQTTLGSTCRVTITRAKTTYTHTIQYGFSGGTWQTAATNVATYYDFDTSTVANHFSSVSSDYLIFRCLTYSGSTYIGQSSQVYTLVSAAGSPTVSSVSVAAVNDNAVIQGWNNGNIFVQGYTRMTITVGYSLPSGASLSNCKISVGGTVVSDGTSTSFTTSTPITGSGTLNISAVITDSRGNTGSGSTNITVYPYSRPYASVVDAIRYSSDVNVEDKENGTNISAKATIVYSSVNSYNTAGVKVRYKEAGGTYPTSATTLTSGNTNHVKINGSTTLSTDKSYLVQFIIYDSLNTESSNPTTVEMIIPTKAVTIHAKDGGTGIAFGGYNTKDAIELWLKTYLYGKLILPSSMYGSSAPSTSGAEVGQIYFQLID